MHLHDNDFDDYIQNHPSVLVMFYAPCKYYIELISYLDDFTEWLSHE